MIQESWWLSQLQRFKCQNLTIVQLIYITFIVIKLLEQYFVRIQENLAPKSFVKVHTEFSGYILEIPW